MKNILALLIAEVNIKEPYLSSKLGIGYAAIGMGMLPRPEAGSLFAFRKISVLVLCGIDKGNISLIRFGYFVKQIKNSFSTGKSHDHGIELLRQLIDRHYEAF